MRWLFTMFPSGESTGDATVIDEESATNFEISTTSCRKSSKSKSWTAAEVSGTPFRGPQCHISKILYIFQYISAPVACYATDISHFSPRIEPLRNFAGTSSELVRNYYSKFRIWHEVSVLRLYSRKFASFVRELVKL